MTYRLDWKQAFEAAVDGLRYAACSQATDTRLIATSAAAIRSTEALLTTPGLGTWLPGFAELSQHPIAVVFGSFASPGSVTARRPVISKVERPNCDFGHKRRAITRRGWTAAAPAGASFA